LFFHRNAILPVSNSSQFKHSTTSIGSTLRILPSAYFQLSQKVFLDLNLIYDVLTLESTFERFDNPALPVRQQRSRDSETYYPRQNLHLRFGIGLKL